MPLIEKNRVLERLRVEATNSSHFVWLFAGLKFFETANHWLFAFIQMKDITLVALEPLIPGAPQEFSEQHQREFQLAWDEFSKSTGVKCAAFISIYGPFLHLLEKAGFHGLKVGQEPWVNLDDCIPRGNSGKGVRQARNQAIRAGLTVEEWSGKTLSHDPNKRQLLEPILNQWRGARLVELGGFLNSIEPFSYTEDRRYFVVRSPTRIEAFLVATPVSGIRGYFLEDLIIRRKAANGCGELATLEAMVALRESGALLASLGVVAMTKLGNDKRDSLPTLLKNSLLATSKVLQRLYNVRGMEVYRSRFRPHEWKSVYLAVKPDPNSKRSETLTWFLVVWTLLKAFRPQLQISREWIFRSIQKPIDRYGFTLFVLAGTITSFGIINHWGSLPDWVLRGYGFSANAPVSEWFIRTLTSDFLFFDASHFILCTILFFPLLAWSERSHKRRFLIPFVLITCFSDDIINYWAIIKPFAYFQPRLFDSMITYKDVGTSLLGTTLLGLQLPQFRRWREPIFAIALLAFIFGFIFAASRADMHRFEKFVLNLNHMLFLIIGFLCGKLEFEYSRYLSRKAAKGKPPIAKSVFTDIPDSRNKPGQGHEEPKIALVAGQRRNKM